MRATGDRTAGSSSPSTRTYVGARSVVTSTDVIARAVACLARTIAEMLGAPRPQDERPAGRMIVQVSGQVCTGSLLCMCST